MLLKDTMLMYLQYCKLQKNLNSKTLKAYRSDLQQFEAYFSEPTSQLSRQNIEQYITYLHQHFKPKTVRRKIASLKAFTNYLEYENLLNDNPFNKLKVKFREPVLLPRTIPFHIIQSILEKAHQRLNILGTASLQFKETLRDVAVLELLFATGIRVSELCSLKPERIDLFDGTITILGKGAKERIVEVAHPDVIHALIQYQKAFCADITSAGFFFINRRHNRLSEQSVRFMINRYAASLEGNLHITPHMFRHSFATLLLEEDVDIRYIQKILGHSSITTTQIYTYVSNRKQRDILSSKHPRNKMII